MPLSETENIEESLFEKEMGTWVFHPTSGTFLVFTVKLPRTYWIIRDNQFTGQLMLSTSTFHFKFTRQKENPFPCCSGEPLLFADAWTHVCHLSRKRPESVLISVQFSALLFSAQWTCALDGMESQLRCLRRAVALQSSLTDCHT